MVSVKKCPNCSATNSGFSTVCGSCSYIMDSDKFGRTLQVEILNELRELNDKSRVTADGVRYDDPIAALRQQYEDGTLDLDELEAALDAEIVVE